MKLLLQVMRDRRSCAVAFRWFNRAFLKHGFSHPFPVGAAGSDSHGDNHVVALWIFGPQSIHDRFLELTRRVPGGGHFKTA